MILVVDNYDSFTYNLVQYLAEQGAVVRVFRNDAIDVAGIRALDPEGVLLSPGPGTPDDAGITLEVVEALAGERPLLGVCLGHQAIAQRWGGRIVRAARLMHGRTSAIHHASVGVFEGLPSPFTATRYHSLIVDPASVPDELEVTAWTDEDEIMGLRHRSLDVEGVQFHPESFLTEHGHALLGRFLRRLPEQGRRAERSAA
ncbi:MAG TPA: aminodeoxychorismate/anthranilate synthase component II [Sandaracinaceae bacterium LLY-WYZ-13_1]|nr:aminodeoxychorismate/anthranilate synthase component II [Sandaracinaceae bacterium LLY-WYZ-13_1]